MTGESRAVAGAWQAWVGGAVLLLIGAIGLA